MWAEITLCALLVLKMDVINSATCWMEDQHHRSNSHLLVCVCEHTAYCTCSNPPLTKI